MPKLYDKERSRAACSEIRMRYPHERTNMSVLLRIESARSVVPLANPYSHTWIRISLMVSVTCEQFLPKPLILNSREIAILANCQSEGGCRLLQSGQTETLGDRDIISAAAPSRKWV